MIDNGTRHRFFTEHEAQQWADDVNERESQRENGPVAKATPGTHMTNGETRHVVHMTYRPSRTRARARTESGRGV